MSDEADLNESISQLRVRRSQEGLDESDIDPDPFVQFDSWMRAALAAGLRMPNEMTLATADARGRPAARIVLLKGVDREGFTFFTNYASRKGKQLSENPHAALVFYWAELERQVDVTGRVVKISVEESDAYWETRPPGSRLGALASPQSEPVASREVLEGRLEEVAARHPESRGVPPRPEWWGGLRVVPTQVELWQGRPDRLHDRLRYRALEAGGWIVERLAP